MAGQSFKQLEPLRKRGPCAAPDHMLQMIGICWSGRESGMTPVAKLTLDLTLIDYEFSVGQFRGRLGLEEVFL